MIREVADGPPISRFAEIIQRSGERMNRLIQDLLDVTRIEQGRLGFSLSPFDPSAIIEEATVTFAHLARSAGIDLVAAPDPNLPVISGDPARLMQVLANLIGNVVEFTPEGGRIRLRCASDGEGVRFSASDTAPGIHPDQVPYLFSRFWQADKADCRGVGLGLSIAKGIVDAHEGRMWVESNPGAGATFHVAIPSAGASMSDVQIEAASHLRRAICDHLAH